MESLTQVLEYHKSDVNWVDWNGKNKLVSCSNDRTVMLWEAEDEERHFRPQSISPLKGHAYGVNCVRYSPFGTIIASASTDGNIILWNSQTGEQVVKLAHESGSAIRVCAFSPSSALLASGSDDETLVVWDISTRRKIKSSADHEAKITGLAFTPDSAFLISSSSNGEIKLWNVKQGIVTYILTHEAAHDMGVLGCDFSSQYEVNVAEGPLQSFYLLATCGNDDLIKLWHIRAGTSCTITLSHKLAGHSGNVNCCTFSMDGSLLASAGGDKVVCVWDPQTGNVLHRLEGHKSYVTCCAFSDDNQLLATGSNDQTVIIWNLENVDGKITFTKSKPVEKGATNGSSVNSDKYVGDWTVEEVSPWLASLGFAQYEATFRENRIDGLELLHLTHDSLLHSLQIEPLGHRSKLLRAMMILKNPLWHQLAVDELNNIRKPGEFCCPITHEIMTDPVLAADGSTYERSAITKWIFEGNSTSPMTNELLHDHQLTPNLNLRSLIQKYQSSFGSTAPF